MPVTSIDYYHASVLNATKDGEIWSRRQTINPSIVVFGDSAPHIKALKRLAPDSDVLTYLPGQDYGTIRKAITARGRRVTLTAIPAFASEFRAEWEAFVFRMIDEIKIVHIDMVTSLRFQREWTRNTIFNLPHIPDSVPVDRMFGQWKLPFVQVATGPSLNDSIDDLRWAQDKALIVAIGSSLPRLLKEGITPDFVIAFDGGLANYRCHFEGLEHTVPLIYDPMLYWRILDDHLGPKVLMTVWPDIAKVQIGVSPGLVAIGPSVSNTAVTLGQRLGASVHCMVGQDLAWHEGKTHAAGTNRYNSVLSPIVSNHISVKGMNGETLQTSQTLKAFLGCFERDAEKYRLYNCTRYGARIEGTIEAPLRDLLCDDVTDAKRALREKLFQPTDWLDVVTGKAREHLYHGERFLAGLEEGESWGLDDPRNALYNFALFRAWDLKRRGEDDECVRQAAIQAMHYCLPKLRGSLRSLEKMRCSASVSRTA